MEVERSLFLNMFTIKGRLRDRLLVNFRVDLDVLRSWLPAPFEPQEVGGWGVAGLCIIRLDALRPQGFPPALGLSTSNVAHRVAATGPGGSCVYILRRDSDSRVVRLAGGRLFPGVHGPARLEISEAEGRWSVEMDAPGAKVRLEARLAEAPPSGSVFEDVDAASRFFRGGSMGWSPALKPGVLEGVELRPQGWNLRPLEVERLESEVYGGFAFDSAFVMRDLDHEWRATGPEADIRARD